MFTIWDFIVAVNNARPIFIISINGVFKDVYTFNELALNDTINRLHISKLRIKSVNGKPTYIIDCEV